MALTNRSFALIDINLYATTLRFAGTNEICTIPNGALCANRIANCTRSPGAIVTLVFHISVLDNENYQVFVEAIRTFVRDNTRIWEALVFHRIVEIVPFQEKVFIKIGVRHRNNWHTAPRIIHDQGEMNKFISKLAERMGIFYDSPPPARLLYNAGSLKKASGFTYMKDIMTPDNIQDFIAKKDD